MSSCLDWDDSSPGNEKPMYPLDDWLGFALRLPLRRSKGFGYRTAGVVALGIALARAPGEPLSEFGRRKLFGPLGIERADWVFTPRGQTSTAGGLELTSRSLLRLGELYLNGGEGLISAVWVAESIRPHARIDAETAYGYLWWLKEYSGEGSRRLTGVLRYVRRSAWPSIRST